MFSYQIKEYPNYEIYLFYNNNIILTIYQIIEFLRSNYNNFIIFFTNSINNTKFKYYFMEFPEINNRCINNTFFLILIKTNKFNDIGDYSRYESYMNTNKKIVKFYGLSSVKNILVVPHPFNGEKDNNNYKYYGHIKGFLTKSPENKIKSFWKKIFKIVYILLSRNKSIFLKTHGLDIPYLHFRIQTCCYNYNMDQLKNCKSAELFIKNKIESTV
jgi:hypothetical protein